MDDTMTPEVREDRPFGKKRKVVLGLLLLITSIVVLLITFTVLTTEKSASPTMPSPQVTEKEAVPEIVAKEREISGTVVFTDIEGEYIKVAVPGEGMYSIGVDTTTVDMESIEPMSEITFVASEDSAEGFYDYVMKDDSLNQAPEKKESIDERLERLRTTNF